MDLSARFSGIAQAISGRFGGPYVDGLVIDQTGAIFDDGGSIATPGTATERECQVQVDSVTEAMRQADGYAEGDVRFLILAASLDGPLGTDAVVRVLCGPNAGTWLVSAIERDAMGVYWQGRGRRA